MRGSRQSLHIDLSVMKKGESRLSTRLLSVCITEFDEKVYNDGIREEGREEGRKQGRKNQMIESIKSLTEKLGVSEEEACRLLGVSVAQYQDAKKEFEK